MPPTPRDNTAHRCYNPLRTDAVFVDAFSEAQHDQQEEVDVTS
jgi:hypothetical protein